MNKDGSETRALARWREARSVRRGGWLSSAASVSLDLLILGATVAAVIFLLGRLWIIVFPSIVALFLAVLLFPFVAWLRSHRWPALAATWVVLLATIALLGGTISLISAPIQSELDQVSITFQAGLEMVTNWLVDGPLSLSQAQIDRAMDRAAEELRTRGGRIVGGLAAGAVRTLEIAAQLFLGVVLAFFFLKDGPDMREWAIRQAPAPYRDQVREGLSRIWETLSSYLRGVFVIAVVDAVLIAVALLVIGVPLVLPLSFLVFLGGFFPFVGALVAGAVASLVALVTSGPLDAALVAGAILVIQQVEGDVLQPAIMSRAVRLHPVVVLLSITAGAGLFGITGAFVAVPLVAIAATLTGYVRSQRRPAETEADPP